MDCLRPATASLLLKKKRRGDVLKERGSVGRHLLNALAPVNFRIRWAVADVDPSHCCSWPCQVMAEGWHSPVMRPVESPTIGKKGFDVLADLRAANYGDTAGQTATFLLMEASESWMNLKNLQGTSVQNRKAEGRVLKDLVAYSTYPCWTANAMCLAN